jgi:glutaredoxin
MSLEARKRRIKFLYWEACQSHDEALARLKRVLAEDQVDAEVEVVEIHSEEEAKRLRFAGSPTIRVDGKDIQPQATTHHTMSCRAYQLEDGRMSPLPSEAMIRAALKRES